MGGFTIDKANGPGGTLDRRRGQRSGVPPESDRLERNGTEYSLCGQYLQTKAGRKATRTEIQRRFGKQIGSKYDMDKLEETMVDRGLIRVTHEMRSKRSNP